MALVKVALAGAMGVGKTALVGRMVDGTFDSSESPTIGVSFRLMRALRVDGRVARLHIWDIAGDPRYSLVAESYIRSVQAIILCYDTTQSETLEQVEDWLLKVNKFASARCQVVLCGTKHDDCRSTQTPANERASTLAAKHCIPWVLTSAKTGIGVQEAFKGLVRSVHSQSAPTDVVRHANTEAQENVEQNPRLLTVLKTSVAVQAPSPLQTLSEKITAPLNCTTVAARLCGDSCSHLTKRTAEHSSDMELSSTRNGSIVASAVHIEEEQSVVAAERAPHCKRQLRV